VDGKVQISPSRLPCLLPSETALIPLGLHCSYPVRLRDGAGRQTKLDARLECCWMEAAEGEATLPKCWSPYEFILGAVAQAQPQTRTRVRNEAGSGVVGLLHFLFNKIINDGKTGSPRWSSYRKDP